MPATASDCRWTLGHAQLIHLVHANPAAKDALLAILRQALAALEREPRVRNVFDSRDVITRSAAREELRQTIWSLTEASAPEPTQAETLAALRNLLQRFEYEMTAAHGDKFGPASGLAEARAAHSVLNRAGRR